MSFSPDLLCQDGHGDLARLGREHCRGRFIFSAPQLTGLFQAESNMEPTPLVHEERLDPFPVWGSWRAGTIPPGAGWMEMLCWGPGTAMQWAGEWDAFSLCRRTVLALKLDVLQCQQGDRC